MAVLALPLLYYNIVFPVGAALQRRVNARLFGKFVRKVAGARATPSTSPIDFTRGLEDLERLRAVSPSTLPLGLTRGGELVEPLRTESLSNGLSNGVPANRRCRIRT
jgi:hypothetical protein